MGQKVHPLSFRLGGIYTWPSKWFSRKDYRRYLQDDAKMRVFVRKALRGAGMDRVEIERSTAGATITIHAAKPGVVIGRGGSGIEELKKKLKKQFFPSTSLTVNIQELDKPALYAAVVAEGIVFDLEKRIPFRTALRQAIGRIQKAGAQGGKIMVAGRLNGAEIARDEKVSFGKIPLQNLRADINYGFDEAHTIYGKIGIKVWVYRGEVFNKKG